MSLLYHNLRLVYRRTTNHLGSQLGRQQTWTFVRRAILTVACAKVTTANVTAEFLSNYCYRLYDPETRDPVLLSDHLDQLTEDEMWASELMIPSESQRYYVRTATTPTATFYISRMGTPSYIGYPFSFTGSFIGVPLSFNARSRAEAEEMAKKLTVGNRMSKPVPVDPKHPAFRDLVDALLLSDTAKRFAVQQTMQQAKYYVNAYFDASCLTGLAAAAAGISYGVNSLFEFHRRKLILPRILNYIVVFGAAATAYMNIRDTANAKHTYVADRETCLFGEEYMLGGMEYLQKLKARNRALYAMGARDGLLEDGEFEWKTRLLVTAPVSIGSRLQLIQSEYQRFQVNPEKYLVSRTSFWGTEDLAKREDEHWKKEETPVDEPGFWGLAKKLFNELDMPI